MNPEELSVQSLRQRIKENLRRHELALTLDTGGPYDDGAPASRSGASPRERLIAFGVRHKGIIKRIPLLNKVATRAYCFLVRRPASRDSSLSVRTKGFIRKIPVLGFLAWWAFSIVKAPSRIAELSNAIAGLREETRNLDAGLRQEVTDLRVQVTQQIDATCNRLVRETLQAADSHTGPKAKAGLWFNEPVKVRYDEAGHPFCGDTTERIIEKAWVLRNLADVPGGARILDVGCSESTLSIELASNGYQVTGIDVRPYPLQHPGFQFVQADICDSPLESASYDVVIALSTIEHLGLGWYGDSQDESSDHVAMQQIHRLLKPGGLLLMTVPYGQRATTPVHRIYDSESLHRLLEKFEIQNAEYGMKMDDRTWISPVPEERAAQQRHDPASGAPSAVCLIRCAKL